MKMKDFALIPLLAVGLFIMSYAPALAAGAAPKVAVHIEKHIPRSCHSNMPEITRQNITSTYGGVGRINAFVVLYDYEEVIGAAFGLTWPETWTDPAWQDCGTMRVGAIHHPGDHTNVLFGECMKGGEPLVLGWLSVTVTSPGIIEVVPSEAEGAVAVVDCNHAMPGVSEVIFTGRGGAGGALGTEISQYLYMRNRTWRITPDGTGDAPSIGAAVRRSIPGDTVAVAGGTYHESVYLRNGVSILGSYSPDFSERDLTAFPSIIDAEDGGTAVIGGLSEDSTCVFDGFVVTGGHGHFGGGIAIRNASSPVLRNLIVHGNHAMRGGGIFCNASSPFIENVLIVGNEADMGGGIACNMGASPRIVRATIAANAAAQGGAVWTNGAAPYIEMSIIAHHGSGGGIHCDDTGSRVTFACVDLWDNQPSDFGGRATAEMGLRDNIAQDPMFTDVGKMDFTLSKDSPCLDVAGCGRLGSTWTKPPEK
ncbi:MAG: right-handed parallel beta-helix repeat-containing protein [bacterium]